ncbi:MAG: hypothetical protein ACRDZM_10940 [Acidimicrobiia bacterium]
MHDHDQDLIAALADGSLDDETEGRALIESCDDCLSEYQDQVEILTLLASTPTAHMTDLERAALHRDLWSELNKPATRPSSPPWWLRWSYVAAGLFVTIGLVSVLSGQTLFGEAANRAAEVSETFSETGSGLGDSSGGAEEAPLYGLDSAEEDAESATTTAAASADTSLPYPFAELADDARAKRASGEDGSFEGTTARDDVEECLQMTGLDDQRVVDQLDLDQRYLVVMPEDEAKGSTVTFIDIDDCEIVYVDE